MGSCFAETIGARLKNAQIPIRINPTGTLYNPLSIARVMNRIHRGALFAEDEIFRHDGVWKNFDHDTTFDTENRRTYLESINRRFTDTIDFFRSITVLILTLGTSFVYRLQSTGEVVANCHRLPHHRFIRELASVKEMAGKLKESIALFLTSNPTLHIILTVSPVRHLRDNPHENTVSKAYLVAVLHEIEQHFDNCTYFPAYEILLDELRDYRFYASDMAHPSPVATDYIWQRFQKQYMSDTTRDRVSRIESIHTAMNHMIRNRDSESSRKFAARYIHMIDSLEKEIPAISLETARKHFTDLLSDSR
jgi:hypothetical protein